MTYNLHTCTNWPQIPKTQAKAIPTSKTSLTHPLSPFEFAFTIKAHQITPQIPTIMSYASKFNISHIFITDLQKTVKWEKPVNKLTLNNHYRTFPSWCHPQIPNLSHSCFVNWPEFHLWVYNFTSNIQNSDLTPNDIKIIIQTSHMIIQTCSNFKIPPIPPLTLAVMRIAPKFKLFHFSWQIPSHSPNAKIF